MLVFEYMVVYSTINKDNQDNKGGGIGRICVKTDKSVESYEDVKVFDKAIKKHTGFDAFAIDFKLLRTYKGEGINETN